MPRLIVSMHNITIVPESVELSLVNILPKDVLIAFNEHEMHILTLM